MLLYCTYPKIKNKRTQIVLLFLFFIVNSCHNHGAHGNTDQEIAATFKPDSITASAMVIKGRADSALKPLRHIEDSAYSALDLVQIKLKNLETATGPINDSAFNKLKHDAATGFDIVETAAKVDTLAKWLNNVYLLAADTTTNTSKRLQKLDLLTRQAAKFKDSVVVAMAKIAKIQQH